MLQAFREDRTLLAAADFIADALGQRFVESVPLNLERALAESAPNRPLICLLSPGQQQLPPEQSIDVGPSHVCIMLHPWLRSASCCIHGLGLLPGLYRASGSPVADYVSTGRCPERLGNPWEVGQKSAQPSLQQ